MDLLAEPLHLVSQASGCVQSVQGVKGALQRTGHMALASRSGRLIKLHIGRCHPDVGFLGDFHWFGGGVSCDIYGSTSPLCSLTSDEGLVASPAKDDE